LPSEAAAKFAVLRLILTWREQLYSLLHVIEARFRRKSLRIVGPQNSRTC